MATKDLIERTKKQVADLTGFASPAGIGLKKEKDGWLVTIEIIEKKSIPDGMDVLGVYDVHVNAKGDLQSYERRALRKRTDTEVGSSEE